MTGLDALMPVLEVGEVISVLDDFTPHIPIPEVEAGVEIAGISVLLLGIVGSLLGAVLRGVALIGMLPSLGAIGLLLGKVSGLVGTEVWAWVTLGKSVATTKDTTAREMKFFIIQNPLENLMITEWALRFFKLDRC
jgi:hypothetical protein